MHAHKIHQPIASARVIVATETANESPWQPPDDSPLDKRIERRPDTTLSSETSKLLLSTQSGRHHVYVTVSYIPVEGCQDGQSICIERPLEFFVPAGQITGEHQWVAATMRSLSLAARGGFVAKALADLRKVTWTQGPVRCGSTSAGKPRFHGSEVAAIAWSLQQMLHERGFLNEHGRPYPLTQLVESFRARSHAHAVGTATGRDEATECADQSVLAVYGECPNPDCRGDMLLIDNCPTCINCGYSKCG